MSEREVVQTFTGSQSFGETYVHSSHHYRTIPTLTMLYHKPTQAHTTLLFRALRIVRHQKSPHFGKGEIRRQPVASSDYENFALRVLHHSEKLEIADHALLNHIVACIRKYAAKYKWLSLEEQDQGFEEICIGLSHMLTAEANGSEQVDRSYPAQCT